MVKIAFLKLDYLVVIVFFYIKDSKNVKVELFSFGNIILIKYSY